MKTLILTMLLIGLAAGGLGCSDDSSPADGPGVDAGIDARTADTEGADSAAIDVAPDLPGADDSGPPDVASDVADDDVPPDLAQLPPGVHILGPSGWQRGVVRVPYQLTGDVLPLAVAVEFSLNDGADYAAATRFGDAGDPTVDLGPGEHVFVWDALSDSAADTDSTLIRITATATDQGSATDTVTFPLLNDPDRDRVALMTNAINGSNKLRRLDYRSGELSFDGQVLEIGARPGSIAFSPSGRVAAVVEHDDSQLRLLVFAEDGALISSDETHDLGSLNVEAMAFSSDGSELIALNFNPTDDGGLHALPIDPVSGLPTPGQPFEHFWYGYAVADFAPMPDGSFVTIGTSQDDPAGSQVVRSVSRDGSVKSSVFFGDDGSIASAIAVSPDGTKVLAAYANLFGGGDGVVLIEAAGGGELTLRDTVEAADPADIAFHSSGDSALVTEAMENRLLALGIGSDWTLTKNDEPRLDLADQIAHTAYGAEVDRFFVTTVSAGTGESGLGVASLSDSAGLTLLGTFSIGGGIDAIPETVAIQP